MDRSMRTMSAVVLFVATCLGSVARSADPATENAAIEWTPRQQALAERVDALGDERLHSADLRLRILYSLDGEDEVERRPEDNGFYARERIPAADLYEQARGATDPLVLQLLLMRCGFQTKTMGRCDRLALAQRWTQVDTQNQLAWLALAGILKERGAIDEAKATFVRAALASTWHEHAGDVARLLARTIPKGLSLQEREWALGAVLMKAGYGTPIADLQTLSDFCKDDAPVMREACARIVRIVARDSETDLGLRLAARLAANVGLDATTVASYQRTADAMRWAHPFPTGAGSFLQVSDDATARTNIALLEAVIAVGERRRCRQVLLEQQVTEAEAARRAVAQLPRAELDRRAAVAAGR